MALTVEHQDTELESVESFLDALVQSNNAHEFCRAIVHGGNSGDNIQGCHLFLLDNLSRLSPVAGYGMPYASNQSEISAWDDSPVALSVRQKSFVFEEPGKGNRPLLTIPLLRDAIPVGALSLVLSEESKELPIGENMIPILSKIGSYCLTKMIQSAAKVGNVEPKVEDLTSRQIQILEFMSEGFVNSQIASKLLLSESTIRQETVRIYRLLSVSNRSEAAKKGRALGIIKSPVILKEGF